MSLPVIHTKPYREGACPSDDWLAAFVAVR
jgi:hypothetical protein